MERLDTKKKNLLFPDVNLTMLINKFPYLDLLFHQEIKILSLKIFYRKLNLMHCLHDNAIILSLDFT